MARSSTPTQSELREQFLRDVQLAAIDTGITDRPAVEPGSDWYILAETSANLAMVAVTNTQIAEDDTDVFRASGQKLDAIRESEGLPEVTAKGSTGKIRPKILGTTTIRQGQTVILPNGLQARVSQNYVAPVDGDEIDIESIDVGTATNFPGGTVVKFAPAPRSVETDAAVSRQIPLTGGVDFETDERKRARIINARRNRPAGGNWGYIRKIITDELPGVQDVYSYPALGGPSSALIVPVRDFDAENRDFSRACSDALLRKVRSVVWGKIATPDENVIRAAVDQLVDFTMLVTLPDSSISGGNGLGWTDATVWPLLVGGDSNTITVTNVGGNYDTITVDAGTSASPTAGQTNVSWWCIQDRKFYSALVTAVSGSAGAWQLTVDRPLVSSKGEPVAIGDYICPSALNLNAYAKTWLDLFRSLGPGEATTDSGRLPRAKRHPYVSDEAPSSITNTSFGLFKNKHPEITDIAFGYSPTTAPTVPGSVNTAPSILVPRRLAFYVK